MRDVYDINGINNLILARCGEIMLKGLNRNVFEARLISNMKKALHGMGDFAIRKSQSRFYVEPQNICFDIDAAIERLTKVFGIVSLSKVQKIESDYESIKTHCCEMARNIHEQYGYKTFKVDSRRGEKSFPFTSPELSSKLGGDILEHIPGISVDVHRPDFTIYVEVREVTYIYSTIVPAHGGMPTGTNGSGLLLLSGGIDSPVAGYMLAKRGMVLDAVHFYSYPYTGIRSKEKVVELARILSEYTGSIKLHIVPFTEIQETIRDKCPEDHMTIIMRRLMMIIAENLANLNEIDAIITGESLGQVASQTIQGLKVTDAVTKIPVFRPLIGMDKNDVISIARRIGSFETSILPYEDCCTVFNSKHPSTKPKLEKVLYYERKLDIPELVRKAIEGTATVLAGE